MAVGVAASTISTGKKYHVFLSFRGEDTRNNFVSYLYAALRLKKIETYKDDVKLRSGDNILQNLHKAIEESKLSIVIFSKNYAFSSWCLTELAHILQCNKKTGHCIIPVFYGVDPSHVRKQEGSYGAAFVELEKGFKNRMDKIEKWRGALTSAANLTGWDSRVTRSESELVDKIVKDVMTKLNRMSPISDDFKDLVGIHERIKAIQPLLCDGSPDVRIIGIWGANGIGKTTLATVLFHRISSHFQSCYFLANVREELKSQAPTSLRRKLFAGLLEEDNLDVGTPYLWSSFVKERLCETKVLVVLDDVSSSQQFDQILLRNTIKFGDESRIIVTTTDFQVLANIKACANYKVEELNKDEALQLFCLHAFDRGSSTEDYIELSKMAVETYAKGLPLALKVLGSYLYSKTKIEWESDFDNLRMISFPEVQDMLRISYDNLDDEEKEIFLDIACFFKGDERDFVESLIDGCNSSSHRRIRDLINKSLITIRQHNKLWMHDLIQEMGREIVRQKSRKDLAKRCRLWNAEDICKVLETNKREEAVEGLFLDVTKINKDLLCLSSAVFSEMTNLRFLKIYNAGSNRECKIYLPEEGLGSLPKSLVYFHWHRYPSKCLPSKFTAENLVELTMPYSHVEELWNENQVHDLGKLKRIDLSYSDRLIRVPNLSSASNLESINLECCISLLQVPLHQNLDKLASLNLNGCTSLQHLSVLPRNITLLNTKNCTKLESIPTNIYELKSLCSLNLSGCSSLKNFPKIARPMESLIDLILDRTAIKRLPSSIRKLIALKTLRLDMCEHLESLPNSISCLSSLQSLSIRFCPKLQCLPALPPSLASVDARNCVSLQRVFSSKAVTEGWSCIHHNGGTFIFYNCRKLDPDAQNNISADARLRLMHIANVTSKYGGDPNMTEICWYGDEIPKWFKHQSKESSIDVALHSDQLDDTFLGFIFCVVVDFKNCNFDGDFEMYCVSQCRFADGFVATWRRTWIWHWNNHDSDTERDKHGPDTSSKAVNSAHVFLFYENGQQVLSNFRAENYTSSRLGNDNKVSLTYKFQPRVSNGHVNPGDFPVKSCGVQLLYLGDMKKLGFLSQEDEQPILEEGGLRVVEEPVESTEEDEDHNEQHLQDITTQSGEIINEGESISCGLQLHSKNLEFCEPCFGKREGYATPETNRLTVTSSKTIQVGKAKWERIQSQLEGLNAQNSEVYNALQRVEI